MKDIIQSLWIGTSLSQNAYNECKRLYDPLEWTKRLVDNIENI